MIRCNSIVQRRDYRQVSREELVSAVKSMDAPVANLRASIGGLALFRPSWKWSDPPVE